MNVAERIEQVWQHYQRAKPKRKAYQHADGDPLFDKRPRHHEMLSLLSATSDPERRKAIILTVCDRVYEAGMTEGRGYVATPDLTLRRLVVGLQHAVSHVHHHCKHAVDWIDSLSHNALEQDDDDYAGMPTGKSAPTAAGSRLVRHSWRRCQKDPCRAVVTIIGDCRLWDLLEEPVSHAHTGGK